MSGLYETFNDSFEVLIANTPELLKEVYRIRFQVLCVEKRLPGFDRALYSDGQEKDNYDSHSIHTLLRHRPTGNFIGTVRLILFDPSNPEKRFPIEVHAQVDPKLCDLSKLERRQTAEISRFVVVGQFNRRKAERRNLKTRLIGIRERIDRRNAPHLALALIAGIVRMCASSDIRNGLSIMDPALNRLFSCFGWGLNPVGPLIEYHGLRQPYFIRVAEALNKMKKKNHEAWKIITNNGQYSQFLTKPDKCL